MVVPRFVPVVQVAFDGRRMRDSIWMAHTEGQIYYPPLS